VISLASFVWGEKVKAVRFAVLTAALFGFSVCLAQSNNYVNQCKKRYIAGYNVSWCIESVAGSTSQDIVYFFHGIGGSEQSWQTLPVHQVRPLLKTNPTVINVSFGQEWFLSDVGFVRLSRLEAFTKEIQPVIESYLPFEVKRRVAMGESMGGYNALRLANRELNQFDHLVALCPAIIAYNVYWSGQKKSDYLEKHPYMDGNILWKLTPFAVWEFPSPKIWNQNNPLYMIQTDGLPLPPTLLTSNAEDQYGFDDGIHQFTKMLEEQQAGTQLVDEAGTHCVHRPALYQQIADFIQL